MDLRGTVDQTILVPRDCDVILSSVAFYQKKVVSAEQKGSTVSSEYDSAHKEKTYQKINQFIDQFEKTWNNSQQKVEKIEGLVLQRLDTVLGVLKIVNNRKKQELEDLSEVTESSSFEIKTRKKVLEAEIKDLDRVITKLLHKQQN